MPDPQTFGEWLKNAAQKVGESGSSSPEFDARLLLMAATNCSSAGLISKDCDILPPELASAANQMVDRRIAGEPVHRILGWREFYGRKFNLSPETLIPRPETEHLVDMVLQNLSNDKTQPRILDIGTGSGVIAISLALEIPDSKVVACDISQDALDTAACNAHALGAGDQITFVKSDLYENVLGEFDVIVSNPPYIPDRDIEVLQCEVRLHDPRAALAGGTDGLDFYRMIFAGAKHVLKGERLICVEIGASQADAVTCIMKEYGFVFVDSAEDLAGITRCLCGKTA